LNAHLPLILLFALTACAGLAPARDPAPAVAVDCRPALPYFCANIHVSCSGRTAIRTFPFRLRVNADRGWIEPEADTAGMRALYENARVDWGEKEMYLILRPREGAGNINLLANGKYSFRHYVQDGGVMSYGHCR